MPFGSVRPIDDLCLDKPCLCNEVLLLYLRCFTRRVLSHLALDLSPTVTATYFCLVPPVCLFIALALPSSYSSLVQNYSNVYAAIDNTKPMPMPMPRTNVWSR